MTAAKEEIYEAVVDFVRNSLPRIPPDEIHRGTELLGNGLDSLAVLDLMALLSDRLGVELDDSDFDAANFETVGHLVGLVESKRAA
jgi:acyl carrier protein